MRRAWGVVIACAALVTAVSASSATDALNVPAMTGTWDITTKVLANSDATGWLGPTYKVGASNSRTWRFEQPCKGADCETDLVRITDVSQAKTRIKYRGANKFAWQENLISTDTCKGKTFTAVTVRTSFVMNVKTVPIPTARPFATSLNAVGKFVATIDVDAYVDAGCSPPPAQIRYTIRYTGQSPEPAPKKNQVYGGPATGFDRGTVKLPGTKRASPIQPGQVIPPGAVIDVSNGRGVTLADPQGRKSVLYGQRDGVPSTFVYAGAVEGFPELRLLGGSFKACTAEHAVRKVWSKGAGKFRTKGRYASARGTWWLTTDTCTSTVVQARKGVATVRDLVTKKTVTVRAPNSYSATRTK
jgi:hypothetical protein